MITDRPFTSAAGLLTSSRHTWPNTTCDASRSSPTPTPMPCWRRAQAVLRGARTDVLTILLAGPEIIVDESQVIDVMLRNHAVSAPSWPSAAPSTSPASSR